MSFISCKNYHFQAEFLKLKAEIFAELAEEEQSKQNNVPTNQCKKCKSVGSSDAGTSGSKHPPVDSSMNSRMNGLHSCGHQGKFHYPNGLHDDVCFCMIFFKLIQTYIYVLLDFSGYCFKICVHGKLVLKSRIHY